MHILQIILALDRLPECIKFAFINSKRIIHLGMEDSGAQVRPPGMVRVMCANCHETFMVSIL